jgi:hypothetical protein
VIFFISILPLLTFARVIVEGAEMYQVYDTILNLIPTFPR